MPITQTQSIELRPSNAVKWMNCPASIQMEHGLPAEASSFAIQGSFLHELAAKCLIYNKTVDDVVFEHLWDDDACSLTDEEIDMVDSYVQFVRSRLASDYENSTLLVEHKVMFEQVIPNGVGTVDAVVINEGVCHIIDFKTGHIPVEAKDNYQLILYALGAVYTFYEACFCDLFKLEIFQSSLNHAVCWEITRDELLYWGAIISEKARFALSSNPEVIPSTAACRYCRARGVCKPLAEHCLSLMTNDVTMEEQFNMREINSLTIDDIDNILSNQSLINLWLKAFNQTAKEKLQQGTYMPNHKLVAGRKTRSWKNPVLASDALKAAGLKEHQIYEKELISPAQAEKLLSYRHEVMQQHVAITQGEPVIAPISDKRQGLLTNVEDEFKDIVVKDAA